jgi:dTDP-4-amino-4,6-dideoxygalactose transaminase
MPSEKPIPWWQVDLGPEAATAAAAAVTSRRLSQGPITEEVEQQIASLVQSKYAIATSSGSTALTLALMAAGAQRGDTVLCPAYTWIATAHAAHVLGCTVVLADIERQRPVIDVNQVPAASGGRCFTIPVHMNGHASNVTGLKEKGYIVIEDAAQALGSSLGGAQLGTIGDFGCFSFSVSKIIGSGQGGILVTDSDEFAARARRVRTHGVLDVFAPEFWECPGHNFRYNDVLAAVLLTQIPLLEQRMAHARATVRAYRAGLEGLSGITIVEHESPEQAGPYVEARVSAAIRNELVDFLSRHGIGARRAFPSLYSAPYLKSPDVRSFPNAEAWSTQVLYLPSGPALGADDVLRVCALIKQWHKL